MVLATKSKNINVLVKIICILISIACIAGATAFAAPIVDAVSSYNVGADDFNGAPLNKGIVDSSRVQNLLLNDIQSMDEQILVRDTKTLKKEFEQYRSDFVSKTLAQFISDKEDYNFDEEDSDEEYYDYFTYAYYIDYNDMTFFVEINENDKISFKDDTEETAKEKIEKKFDTFINSSDFSNYLQAEDRTSIDAVYSVTDAKNNINYSNAKNFPTDKEVLEHKYSFIVKNDVLTSGEGFNGLFSDSIDPKTGKCSAAFNDKYEYRFYVDENSEAYAGYSAAIANAEKCGNVNLLNNLIKSCVLIFVALIFAIISFVICGKRDRTGKVKRMFIDYVPTDLHLVITVGLQVALCALFGFTYDAIDNYVYPFENFLYYVLYASAALIWALFIEFGTSFIRVCKSEKKLYQNTLVYLIIKYLIVKPCKFIISKLKSFFTYQPVAFNKLLRRILISYGALNAFFILVILICAGNDAAGGACFFFAVSIAVNIALLVYAVKYIKNLDAIITAAHFRQVPQVDYNKLPNSLKVLVNSLNYTRAELQNAVEKAVKDERMRTELITNVSHDLRTPLTSIITYVDLLKGCDIEDENAREYIAVLDEKGGKLKRLIDDLIEASKITSGVINVEPININLSELGTQAIVEHQQEFAENGLELVFKGDQKNIGAFADGTKTFRIIENLISNARKYSLRGTRVYADVYETQNFSIFEIKNTSAEPLDIPASELKQRFVRGDKSRANEGNGLGLSIAENLCTAQNGHLNITIDGDLFKAQVMLPKTKN